MIRRSSGRRRDRFKAFTLVEVLVALLMLAVLLPTVMKGITIASTLGSHARRINEATALASWKLNELATSTDDALQHASGDFAPEHSEYRWTATYGSWLESGLQELKVEVTWEERGRQRSVWLTTLVPENTS